MFKSFELFDSAISLAVSSFMVAAVAASLVTLF